MGADKLALNRGLFQSQRNLLTMLDEPPSAQANG